MKVFMFNILSKIFCSLPMRKIIIFESNPDCSDNSEMVFNEMIKRQINRHYKLVWLVKDIGKCKNRYSDIKNVRLISKNSATYRYYYSFLSRAFITSNDFPYKRRKDQYYIYLAHGCALKDAKGKHSVPENCSDCDVVTLSDFLAKYDSINLSCDLQNMRVLGYPRNDTFFQSKKELYGLFSANNKTKFIYWLPTFRQHKYKVSYSSISIPVLHNKRVCEEINYFAQKNNVILIIKPHPSQDISFIQEIKLSNLVFINDGFLYSNQITNYELLNSADALLTDYSSVYYDYLLKDKPIGLCWEDFGEYSQKEGFRIDPNFIMAGGEKIYSESDLKSFIKEIAEGKDILKEKRNDICHLVHKYIDGESTKRVVDYIMLNIQE